MKRRRRRLARELQVLVAIGRPYASHPWERAVAGEARAGFERAECRGTDRGGRRAGRQGARAQDALGTTGQPATQR